MQKECKKYNTHCIVFIVFQSTNGSTLTINSVSVSHSGNYSCQPSSMRPDSVLVTILAESKSANALQDKASSAHAPRPLARALLLLLVYLLMHHALPDPRILDAAVPFVGK
jgi:hypothetical protein